MQHPHELSLAIESSRGGVQKKARLMIFRPEGGAYPFGTFFCEDGFFHADEDIAFSVVKCGGWKSVADELPFSEFAWASPAQVRILGSLLFCQVIDEAWVRLYPVIGRHLVLEPDCLDLADVNIVQLIRSRILNSSDALLNPRGGAGAPASISCAGYDLLSSESVDMSRFSSSYQSIDPRSLVLMRGIQALVKSDMLGCHQEFGEESVLSIYIAMDASFSLIQRELIKAGNQNPSANDAAKWLHRVFDEPYGFDAPGDFEKYLGEFYESRISAIHPASRFGDCPFPPAIWGDAIHLRSILRQIFSYLVHGTHFDDFDAAVSRFHCE
ncbi:hypothetical protein [Stenotrophomonas maltophilia]|uniref:hypothetical protein n=1 Tax=Stenotrophomonas maltophilia TaxID=40324 RepID=UPI0013D9B214|nr:hypothetical protein [Stenotrophomonas maltophilia]